NDAVARLVEQVGGNEHARPHTPRRSAPSPKGDDHRRDGYPRRHRGRDLEGSAWRLPTLVRAIDRGGRRRAAVTLKRIPLELPPEQAIALAQFVKRTGFDDCERLGNRYDGGAEAEEMWAAIQKLQQALKEAGFSPR